MSLPAAITNLLPPAQLIHTPRGMFNFAASASTTTTEDYQIASPLRNGGFKMYVVNANPGDTLDAYLVDKDNILGMGGTPSDPTVIVHPIRGLYVFPNQLTDFASPAIPIPLMVGLYIRVIYTSTGSLVNPQVLININSYEQWSDFLNDAG